MLYTFALFSAPVVVILYWGLIHSKHLVEIEEKYREEDPALCDAKIVHAYVVHIVPPLSSLILCLATNTVLLRRHVRHLNVLGVIYLTSNFVSTQLKGEPVYWFMHWRDYSTLLVCLAMLTGFSLLFLGLCILDETVTGKPNSKSRTA